MNTGYAKIKLAYTAKSRSMDFSDLPCSFPESTDGNSNTQEGTKQIKNRDTHEAPSDVVEDGIDGGERFGHLRQSSSSSSKTATLQSAVKRAFSMRRSSSVSERYCRIHDQCVTLSSSLDGGDDDFVEGMDSNTSQTRRSMRKKNQSYSSGRILKACKRILGL